MLLRWIKEAINQLNTTEIHAPNSDWYWPWQLYHYSWWVTYKIWHCTYIWPQEWWTSIVTCTLLKLPPEHIPSIFFNIFQTPHDQDCGTEQVPGMSDVWIPVVLVILLTALSSDDTSEQPGLDWQMEKDWEDNYQNKETQNSKGIRLF